MTIREIIDGKLFPSGTYNIGFTRDDLGEWHDETQFLCRTQADLEDLWADFADENGFARDSVEYIEREQDDVEILEEFLERTCAVVGKRWSLDFPTGENCLKWMVTETEHTITFPDWWDMITYMDEQNEEMRG